MTVIPRSIIITRIDKIIYSKIPSNINDIVYKQVPAMYNYSYIIDEMIDNITPKVDVRINPNILQP